MLSRRGLFQVLGAALAAREVPRLVPPAPASTRTLSYGALSPSVQELMAALEGYERQHPGSMAPTQLTQGCALQIEDVAVELGGGQFPFQSCQLRFRT